MPAVVAFTSSSENVRDLAGRFRRNPEQPPEGRPVRRRLCFLVHIETRHEVAPTQQLAPQPWAVLDAYRQIGEIQGPLISIAAASSMFHRLPLARAVHLASDQENLLTQRKRSPPIGCEAGMLGHPRGSPSPMKRNER